MSRPYLAVTGLLLLPIVVFVSGAWIMSRISGRRFVTGQKPLNQRLGYDLKAVDRYWRALDRPARRAEQRFLTLDLVFPIFYGAALAASLLMASALLSGGTYAVWMVVPVLVTVVADWVENLVQLDQLRSYIESGEAGLAAGWIRLASGATIVKLLSFSISFRALLVVLALILWRARP